MKVEEPIEGSEIENTDYDDGVHPKEENSNINPREPIVQEPSTTKERQIVSRQNNDAENENLNVYTRSGR